MSRSSEIAGAYEVLSSPFCPPGPVLPVLSSDRLHVGDSILTYSRTFAMLLTFVVRAASAPATSLAAATWRCTWHALLPLRHGVRHRCSTTWCVCEPGTLRRANLGRGARGVMSAGLQKRTQLSFGEGRGTRRGPQTVRTAHGRFLEHAAALGDWVLLRGLRAAGARRLLLVRALVVLEHAVHLGERRSLAVVIAQARAAVRLTQMMARASRAPA